MTHKRLQRLALILACLAAVSCERASSRDSVNSNQNNLPQANDSVKTKQTETAADTAKENPQTSAAAPKDNFPAAKKGQCVADDAARPEGVPENININEQTAMPQTAEEFNAWLSGLLGSQLVLDSRFIDISTVGDFNGDGCNDVAVPVTPDKDYEVVSRPDDPRAKPRTNRSFNEYVNNFVACGIYLVNLQNNASELACSKENSANRNDFAKQFSTQSSTALLIIHGGKKGWSWKSNAAGRTALLLNVWSVQTPDKASNAIDFNVVSRGYKYDEYALPKTAKGDGIYLGFNLPAAKSDKNKLTQRRLIYFDGNNYQFEKLPDATAKQEVEP